VKQGDHHGKKPNHGSHSGTRHPGTHKPHHHHTRKPRDLSDEPELRANTRAPKPTRKPNPTHGPKPSAKPKPTSTPKPTRRRGPVAPSRKPTTRKP
jgi:endoglucanase